MRDLETIVAQNAKRLTRAPQGISPYLLRPLRTLEQALHDRGQALRDKVAAHGQVSVANLDEVSRFAVLAHALRGKSHA